MVSYLDQGGVQHLVDKLLDRMYPVYSIYISTNSTSPASLYGGSWERYGTGRVLISASDTDTDFKAGKTGGKKNIEWSTKQNGQLDSDGKTKLGFYNRTMLAIRPDASIVANLHSGDEQPWNSNSGILKATSMQWSTISNINDSIDGFVTIKIPGMNPYVSVYIWRRTA